MRHLLAVAMLCVALGLTVAGTRALRPGSDLEFLVLPARMFDWPLCG